MSVSKPRDILDEWSISLYPNGHTFAFTLVHDADGAYSRRLAPLFNVFDQVGLKITATVFVSWANWAANGRIWTQWKQSKRENDQFFAPQCVPLVDDNERQFYQHLATRGHEIGMHTPSETSSERVDVIRGFEYFQRVFGRYPTVYVEHSANNNKDAQSNEGSAPESIYYNSDLLNSYGPWVWLDDEWGVPHNRHAQFYDILAANGSPFNRRAAAQYGITKAFLRTGKWREGDGDGFLAWYSEENIDSLEKNRGLALVYTHLDNKWLDPRSREIRSSIQERLQYLTSKNGWFMPAGKILDRLYSMRGLHLRHNGKALTIINAGGERVDGLTLISHQGRSLCRGVDIFRPTGRGEIVLGRIHAGESLSFKII